MDAAYSNHPDAKWVDGVLYLEHKGKLETIEEREVRLQHNHFVKFSRSFDRDLHHIKHVHVQLFCSIHSP